MCTDNDFSLWAPPAFTAQVLYGTPRLTIVHGGRLADFLRFRRAHQRNCQGSRCGQLGISTSEAVVCLFFTFQWPPTGPHHGASLHHRYPGRWDFHVKPAGFALICNGCKRLAGCVSWRESASSRMAQLAIRAIEQLRCRIHDGDPRAVCICWTIPDSPPNIRLGVDLHLLLSLLALGSG